jgi:alpha-amylase
MRSVIAALTCLVLGLAGACGTADAPTREELFAGLLAPSDLGGSWHVDAAEQVAEGESGPTPFRESCPELIEEPAWQAFTALSAQGLESGRALQVVEFVLAGDPAETQSTYADFTDAIDRCGERQTAQPDVTVLADEDLDLGKAGEEYMAGHISAVVQTDVSEPSATDQYLAVVRDGPLLAVILTTESIPLAAWPGDPPEPSLGAEQMAAVVATALGRLSGRLAPPPATGEPVPAPAPWWNDAVFYEVFVRSFADSDGDGDGDLTGLTGALDYLNDGDPATDDDLGVTALWLMPVMQSPSYHGYDTTDYFTVEEDYGTNDDFRRLVAAAHDRGMRVIVDLVLNHTSSEHPWFLSSAEGPDSPERDWYVWRADNPFATTSWGTPAWHERNGAYYLGLFWEGMPDLNLRNPEVTTQMEDVARFWFEDMGVDGFRLDAVRHLVEDGDVFEGTAQTHAWLADWDDFLDADASESFFTVGEVWDDTAEVAPYVTGGEVDVAFEFTLADAILTAVERGDPRPLDHALTTALAAYPPGQFATFLTNHDQDRVMSRLGGDGAEARLAATFLLTLPGVPFVYYGEEIGMTGAKPDERIRTPMQWSDEPNAGFSTARPWEPPNSDFLTVNVAAQDADVGSLLSRYRRLVHLRGAHPALRTGDLDALGTTCGETYAYLRTARDAASDDAVLVVANLSSNDLRDCSFTLEDGPLTPGGHDALDALTGEEAATLAVDDDGDISGYVPAGTLPATSALILELTPTTDTPG